MSKLDKQIRDITTRMFAYGIDWTEYKEKGPHEHKVSTYAGKIKQAMADEVRKDITKLIAQQVKEAVDLEKSLRAKTGTERYKDGIQDGLQMALYGTKDGSKEEKFIRHLLYSESIEKYNG